MENFWDRFRGPAIERDNTVAPSTQAARFVGPLPVAGIMVAYCLFWAGIPARMIWPVAHHSGVLGLFGEVLLAALFTRVLLCLMDSFIALFESPWANAKRMIDKKQ